IAEYIFEQLFSNIIQRCLNDNEETLNLESLVISRDDISGLLLKWEEEIREKLTKVAFEGTAYGLFEEACDSLKEELVNEYAKESIQEDLIETLGWFRSSVKD